MIDVDSGARITERLTLIDVSGRICNKDVWQLVMIKDRIWGKGERK